MRKTPDSVDVWSWLWRGDLQIFAFLQLLDFLSTMIGLRLGLSEASPSIRPLIAPLGSGLAIGVSKGIAFGLLGLCFLTHRQHLIRIVNYWFAALVVWNLVMILFALSIRR